MVKRYTLLYLWATKSNSGKAKKFWQLRLKKIEKNRRQLSFTTQETSENLIFREIPTIFHTTSERQKSVRF